MSCPSAMDKRTPTPPEDLSVCPRIALIGDVQGYAHTLEVALRKLGVHGHEKVRTYGHERSALMATKSPQFWPPKVRTPH
jgi:hypothetical protein